MALLKIDIDTVECSCAAKFSDQVRKEPAGDETASSSGMKKSRVTGSCLSQNVQNIRSLRGTEWSAGRRLFHAAPIWPLELGMPRPNLWRIPFFNLRTVSLKNLFSATKLYFTSMGRLISQCMHMGNWKPTCCNWARLGFSETERFLCHFH